MNDHCRLACVRRLGGTAVLTAFISALATPALAASPTTSSSSPFSPAAVARIVKSGPPPAATAAAPAKTPARAPQARGSFIKSKVGVMVVAVFAVGTGYAIYSAREDRIRGLNR